MAYDADTELQELRKRRVRELQEMQTQGGGPDPYVQAAQQAEMQRRESERAEILRKLLTPEARERLGRIRLAKPDVANAVEQQVISLAASGRLARQIDDNTLRALLERIMPQRREINITRR
ncbi:MAG TPA: DNA-binding protein [Thermoplasmata archaeon]|nr:DNA-binding protein [Thermoplasmata archaeon]